MIKDFISSFGYYIDAFNAIGKYKLWSYTIKSGLLSLLIGLVLFIGIYFLSAPIADYFAGIFSFSENIPYFETIIRWLINLVFILIFLLLYKHILLLLLGAYMGVISINVEKRIIGDVYLEKNSELKLLVNGVSFELGLLRKELLYVILFLIVGVLPIIGIISPIMIYLIQSYYAGSSNIGAYLGARRYDKKQILTYIKQNRGLALGNGLVFLLLLLIPFFGLFFAPSLSVTALTLRGIRKNGHQY